MRTHLVGGGILNFGSCSARESGEMTHRERSAYVKLHVTLKLLYIC